MKSAARYAGKPIPLLALFVIVMLPFFGIVLVYVLYFANACIVRVRMDDIVRQDRLGPRVVNDI